MVRWKEFAPWWLVLTVLPALVIVTAIIQYKSLGQLSEAEQARLRANLQSATGQFENELDRELNRLFIAFASTGAQQSIGDCMRRWNASAAYPHLLKSASLASAKECLSRPCPVWVQNHLSELLTGSLTDKSGPPRTELVFDEVPALAIARFSPTRDSRPSPRQANAAPMVMDWVILELDRDYLSRTLLPDLSQRWFGSRANSGYQVAVVRSAHPEDVLYESPLNSAKALLQSPDSIAPLLRLPSGSSLNQARGDERFFHRVVPAASGPSAMRGTAGWRLVVRHEAGSLEAAVARARVRNWLISGSSLFLLTAAVATLLVLTRRAQLLAKSQLEFVAGVSHELKTPLSVIHSAGYNLSHGVVSDWARASEYGTTIRAEARRLTDIIDRAMRYAALESGRDSLLRERVELRPVLEAAIAEYLPVMHQAGLEVRLKADPNLPAVCVDAAAVRHCIQNLLGNAAKYATQSDAVFVQAALCENEVQVCVEDHGPGIHPDDLPNIFRAFYRGQNGKNCAAQGVGLGLTLVKRIMRVHQGRVSVDTHWGEGTKITLHFPAAEAAS